MPFDMNEWIETQRRAPARASPLWDEVMDATWSDFGRRVYHRAIDDNFVKAIMTGLLRYDNSPGTEVPQIQLAARLRNYLWTGVVK